MTAPAIFDRATTLTALANGDSPESVFGPDRERAITELVALIGGITPTRDDVVVAALTADRATARKVNAYRTGLAHLHDAYYDRADKYAHLNPI